MPRRRDVLVPLTVNWLELFLVGLCVLSGAAGLFGFGTRSQSHLPPWADIAWFGLLLVGGGLAAVGLCWREAITGLLIERAGLFPVAAGAFMYAVALADRRQWLTAVVVAAFGGAVAAQGWTITRLVRTRGSR